MVRRKEKMEIQKVENMRGGDGTVIFRHIASKDELMGNGRLMALLTLEPGCSLGLHEHEHEAEYFYVVKGNITAIDDEEEVTLYAGDGMITGNGHKHSIKNNGSYTAELIAVILNGDRDF